MLAYNMDEDSSIISYNYNDNELSKVLPFCITRIGDFTCSSRYFTKRFGLNQCLILFTLSGQGTLTYKTQEVIVSADDIVLFNCNNYQYYATVGNSDWHFKWIHFLGLCAIPFSDNVNKNGLFIAKNNPDIEKQLAFIFDTVQNAKKYAAYDLSLSMHSILTNIQNQQVHLESTNISKSFDKQPELNYALSYMQDNFNKSISIVAIAKTCKLSEYHFIRLFTAYTGYTPYDYVLTLRINQAKKLLLETQLNVNEISYKVGFTESKNLITNFKKKEGITPSLYRKNYVFNF